MVHLRAQEPSGEYSFMYTVRRAAGCAGLELMPERKIAAGKPPARGIAPRVEKVIRDYCPLGLTRTSMAQQMLSRKILWGFQRPMKALRGSGTLLIHSFLVGTCRVGETIVSSIVKGRDAASAQRIIDLSF